jgi:Right handed beta helix region
VSVAEAAAVQAVVRNCTFTDNTAPVCCGALFIGSTALIDGCTFNDNAVVAGAAGALSTHQSTVLTNSNFSRNSGHAVSLTASCFYVNLNRGRCPDCPHAVGARSQ